MCSNKGRHIENSEAWNARLPSFCNPWNKGESTTGCSHRLKLPACLAFHTSMWKASNLHLSLAETQEIQWHCHDIFVALSTSCAHSMATVPEEAFLLQEPVCLRRRQCTCQTNLKLLISPLTPITVVALHFYWAVMGWHWMMTAGNVNMQRGVRCWKETDEFQCNSSDNGCTLTFTWREKTKTDLGHFTI